MYKQILNKAIATNALQQALTGCINDFNIPVGFWKDTNFSCRITQGVRDPHGLLNPTPYLAKNLITLIFHITLKPNYSNIPHHFLQITYDSRSKFDYLLFFKAAEYIPSHLVFVLSILGQVVNMECRTRVTVQKLVSRVVLVGSTLFMLEWIYQSQYHSTSAEFLEGEVCVSVFVSTSKYASVHLQYKLTDRNTYLIVVN